MQPLAVGRMEGSDWSAGGANGGLRLVSRWAYPRLDFLRVVPVPKYNGADYKKLPNDSLMEIDFC